MDYLNPIRPINKNNSTIKKTTATTSNVMSQKTGNTRRNRSDKTKNCKFPLNPIEQMKLRSYCKQAQRLYKANGKTPLSQTKFNNMLLRFGLKNLHIVNWNQPYTDSGMYMHTNILETEFIEIGGPHGLAVRKNLSERKVVYFIIISVLRCLEGEGELEKVL